jgi:hypothetical protein
MNFYQWLLLNENVETNFNKWLETLFQYTKKNTDAEKVLMKIPGVPARSDLIGVDPKNWEAGGREQLGYIIDIRSAVIIKTVLKEKNIENFNWFSFSIGYYSAKPGFFKEDLELAIDVTKQRIDSRELPKTEIGAKGWLIIGYESKDKVQEYLQSQQQVSNRQLEKMKKSGVSLDENENLIKMVVNENNIKIYYLPSLKSSDHVKERHLLLCKYGKGTDWCTAQPSWDAHTGYTGNNIYIIHVDDKPAYQFVGCKDGRNKQFMDTKDQYVDRLNGDVYDTLAANLNDQFDCYLIRRKTGLKDLLKPDSKKREAIYNALSEDDFFELIRLANTEQKNKILKDDKSNYLKFTNFFNKLNEILHTTSIRNIKELVENLSRQSFKLMKQIDMPSINFSKDEIENFINNNISLIVWKYYRELRINISGGVREVGNNLLQIFGKENIEKEYPALKITRPEKYFKDTWNADETGKKPRVNDSTEGNAPSIERILSSHVLYDGDKTISRIEAMEKVGVENLNFQNKNTSLMRRILFEGKDFDKILNYFKEKNLIKKVEAFVADMNEIDVNHITERYFEDGLTAETLDEFRKQDFYKVLKYLHETGNGLGNLMNRRGIDGIINDYDGWSRYQEASDGVLEQGIFEIVGEENFKISWINDFKIAKRLIFNNKTDSKLFNFIKNKETVAKDPRNNSYHKDNWEWLFNDINKGDPHTIELLSFLIEKMPDNDNLTYAFLYHGNLDKQLIDKHEDFTKRILEKYGKGVGEVDANGVFIYKPETKYATIMIDQENIKYAWKKYLDITIKDFKDKQDKTAKDFDPSIL